MTDIDTQSTKAGKRGGAKAKPVDSKAFLGMLTDARKLLDEFRRALKQVSPKLTMRDYMALARINNGSTDQPADGSNAAGDAKKPGIRKGVANSLQQAGLVTTPATEGSTPEITDQGRKVLADMDTLLASIVGKMKGKKGAATQAGARNVPMALKAVKQSTRTGKGEAGAKGGRGKKQREGGTAAGEATKAPAGSIPA